MSNVAGDPGRRPEGREIIERRAWTRARQWAVSGAAAALLFTVVIGVWLGGRLYGGRQAPVAAAPPSPPGTFKATPQQLKTLTIEPVGTHVFYSQELTEGKIAVDGDRATPVYSPFSGRVIRVIAAPGDAVRKGAALAAVEASEFVQAQSDLSTNLSQVKLARINETRKHALYDAKGGSLQDWQQAQSDLASAETVLSAARNRLRILGKSDTDIAALESGHGITPVATLAAPIAGVVVDRQVGPGQYLQSGSGTPVFTIADPSSVWLLANVRESDAGRVARGQPMEVRVPAYPERTFTAQVTYVAAVVDPVTHRLAVRAVIDNRDGALKPEMFASFRILTSGATVAPALPENAVIYEGDVAHVWLLTGADLLTYRVVRTGRSNEGFVEILEGVQPGDEVVTKGGLFIDQVAVPGTS